MMHELKQHAITCFYLLVAYIIKLAHVQPYFLQCDTFYVLKQSTEY